MNAAGMIATAFGKASDAIRPRFSIATPVPILCLPENRGTSHHVTFLNQWEIPTTDI
ncbi:hypothetical protein [Shinella sp. G-2]|uniref:hypothetical protein n=1 Tax=Shinella sp. G-2 TaxID=3133141 RepID=UPI003D056A74